MNNRKGETDPNNDFNVRFEKMKQWNSPIGTTSSAAKNTPRMGVRHKLRINKHKLTRWRQYIFCSVLTRSDIVYYSIIWGTRKNWAGIKIFPQPHRPWIYCFIQKVVFKGTINTLMIIVAVEDEVKQNDTWDTILSTTSGMHPRMHQRKCEINTW